MIGSVVSHYRILAPLGEGGMGVVYLAQDQVLERRVALKVLRPESVGDATRRARFLQEARSAAALHHPNIATIFEANESPDGTLFIAMEHVEGQSLRRELVVQMPLEKSINIARQIAEGLAHAHANHVVHRDLKPENVLLTPDGRAKILDFGLAKLARPTDGATLMMNAGHDASATALSPGNLTVQGQIMGTPAYMSPEQARGHEVDFRSDLFSFGSMLYEMCAGQPSFMGPTPLDTLTAVLHVEPQPPSRRVRGVPPSLDRVIARCMQKDPAKRYESTDHLVRDLRGVDLNRRVMPVPVPRIDKRILLGGAALLLAATAGALVAPRLLHRGGGSGAAGTAAAGPASRILIADFENNTSNAGLGVATRELVNAALLQSTLVTPIPRNQLQRGLQLSQLPDTTRITGEVAKQLAYRGSAHTFLEGRVDQLGQGYNIVLRVVDTELGNDVFTISGAAKTEGELIRTLEKVSGELREKLGESRSEVRSTRKLRETQTPSFEAYQLYVGGVELLRKRQWNASNQLFRRALALDPDFANAWKSMGVNYENLGLPDSARAAYEAALSDSKRLAPTEKTDLEIKMRLADYDLTEAHQLSEALMQQVRTPTAANLNNHSFIQFGLGQYEDALETQLRATTISPYGASQLVFLNAFQIAMQVGDEARGRALLDSLKGPNRQLATLAWAVSRDEWARAESLGVLLRVNADDEKRFQAGMVLAADRARRGAAVEAARALEALIERAPTQQWADVARMARVQLGILVGQPVHPDAAFLASPTLPGEILRGVTAAALGDTTTAEAMLRAAAARPIVDRRRYAVDLQLLDGWKAASRGEGDQAAALVEPVAVSGPGPWFTGRIPLRWLAAACREQAGPDSSAIQNYRLVLDPKRLHHDVWVWRSLAIPFAHYHLAVLEARAGHRVEAEKHARAVIESFTDTDALTAPILEDARSILRSAQSTPG